MSKHPEKINVAGITLTYAGNAKWSCRHGTHELFCRKGKWYFQGPMTLPGSPNVWAETPEEAYDKSIDQRLAIIEKEYQRDKALVLKAQDRAKARAIAALAKAAKPAKGKAKADKAKADKAKGKADKGEE
jgi:hypothetical protein